MDAEAISLFLGENRGSSALRRARSSPSARRGIGTGSATRRASRTRTCLAGRDGGYSFFAAGSLLIVCGVMIEFHS